MCLGYQKACRAADLTFLPCLEDVQVVQVHHLLLCPCEPAEMSVYDPPNLLAPPKRTKMTALVVIVL